MAISVNGEPKRVGLALSGGGFRAALYHLGVFRQLHEWGILWDLDLISSVSGGSIAGGFMALRWGDDSALDDLEKYLTSQSVTKTSFFTGAISPFESRTEALADAYDRQLFKGATLADSARGPRSYIGTTNLGTGNYFAFVAGGNQAAELGEHELGYQSATAGSLRVADAVAASSAFSPIFPPMRLDQDIYPNAMDFVTLTDGGFYDNLAINPLVAKMNQIDYAIISDAGKPFALDDSPTESGFMAVRRAIDIMAEQVRSLQFKRLVSLHKSAQGPKPIWFSIDSHIGCAQAQDPIICSAVLSDLSEIDTQTSIVLQRHARSLLTHRISNYAPELIGA